MAETIAAIVMAAIVLAIAAFGGGYAVRKSQDVSDERDRALKESADIEDERRKLHDQDLHDSAITDPNKRRDLARDRIREALDEPDG